MRLARLRRVYPPQAGLPAYAELRCSEACPPLAGLPAVSVAGSVFSRGSDLRPPTSGFCCHLLSDYAAGARSRGIHPVTAGRPACNREKSSLGYPQQRVKNLQGRRAGGTLSIRQERAGVQKEARNGLRTMREFGMSSRKPVR